ncbi:flagellar hook-associated protein FlgK [Sporichthya brevicatena]|uniref:Flagellar hook-associated protein 1 n=1 Tax=Sporichthya brevicatena TaxID=171442 RepID=A0ABN1GDP3_9ACTN
MTSFSGLSTALTGLQAARRGLDVTGQNIANANTDGYTRQRVVQQSVGAPEVPALWATYDGAGGGVRVTDVARLSDDFLTARARSESGTLAQLTARQATMAGVESVLGEPGDTGIASQLSDLWAAWHDVANRPGDVAARAQLLARTTTVADGLRAAHLKLDTQWTAGREQLAVAVDQVNTTAANVAELNQAILRSTQAGIPVNELRDQRDQLINALAAATGAVARAGEDGTIDVYLGGIALVRGERAETLAVTGATSMTDLRAGSSPAPAVTWTSIGTPAVLGGSLGGQVEALGVTIPKYADDLDSVAFALRDAVNAAHTAGYDLDGNAGVAMFSATATAKDITNLVTDPRLVAASGQAPNPDPSLDGSNASVLAEIGRGASSPDNVYRRLVVDVGAAAQAANRRQQIQASVSTQAAAALESAVGVNVDEEMVGLLSYQRAYEAAARVITAIDEALDVLINRTGLVGR